MKTPSFQPPAFKKSLFIFWLAFLAGISLVITGFVLLKATLDFRKEVFLDKTTISQIDVSLLTEEEALLKIKKSLNEPTDFQLVFKVLDEAQATLSSTEIAFKKDLEESIETAFVQNHQDFSLKNPLKLISLINSNKDYSIKNKFDQEKTLSAIKALAEKIDRPGNAPFASLAKSSQPQTLTIDSGKEGLEIDQENLALDVFNKLTNKNDFVDLEISTTPKVTHFELSPEEVELARKRALIFVGQNIRLKNKDFKDVAVKLIDTQIIPLLSFPDGFWNEKISEMSEETNKIVSREPESAEFEYEQESDTKLNISLFKPHKTGLAINRTSFEKTLIQTLEEIEKKTQNEGESELNTEKEDIFLELPLETVEPEITLEKTNDLGINGLIGFGDSEYDHSIPNRIFNVSHATNKITNTIIAPGKEFRFNNELGEVSKGTGYKSAYVISGGKTILGDGGGVCQVSTTIFRAALNAGLPITKRRQHAYRVSYYELNQKPGIDATVYSGEVDLRFINDTPGYILIRGEADPKELYMKIEIYGTSDGRTAEIVDHKTWGERGAPAPVYYPTTDIPPGSIKQIDWAVSGIKASFKNITKNKAGEIIKEEEFYSNYIPWSAKYLKGI